MAIILDSIEVDTVATPVAATAPVLITVTGNLGGGMVKITANLGVGAGEALVYTFYGGDSTSFHRLEFAAGVTWTAALVNSAGDNVDVTVAYITVT